jgi:AraC-like DNA-binding protein
MKSREPQVVFQNTAWSPLGRVMSAGHERYRRYRQLPPMRVLGNYALIYVLRGQGRFSSAGGAEQAVGAGDLVLLFPGVAHSYEGEQWDEFWIMFEGRLFDLWRQHGLLDPKKPILHLEPVAYWWRRFREIVAGPSPRNAKEALEQICRLQHALADALLQDRRDPAAEADSAWLARACTVLDTDPLQPLDMAAAATQLGTSYEVFRKRFVRLAGVSPSKYRATRLMDLACELLHQRDLTNKEMAERLGICDEYHFSRRFKQVIGLSPGQFRQHWRRE